MLALELFIGVMVFSFICEFIDSTLGMGYGTTATPLLMLVGMPVLEIIPAILLSELISGFLSGFSHHTLGNVNFNLRSIHLRVTIVLALCSVIGAIIAVNMAVKLPSYYLKLYIGLLVLSMGILILLTRNKKFGFSWKKIIGLGLLSSFNKGMSGGGYGPVVMSGQLLSGIKGKSAVGITSVAESLTSLVGLMTFIFVGTGIYLDLALPMILGACCSVPFAAYTTKRTKTEVLKTSIGLLTILLGLITLITLI